MREGTNKHRLRSSGGQQPIHRTVDAFGDMAALYSTTWFDDPVMEPSLNQFLSLVPPGSSILDAGCGPGRDVRFLINKGFETVGIDLSIAMLNEAKHKVPDGCFRRMDIREPRYPPRCFGGIWACASLHHITAPEAEVALRRYWTLLSPGGILAVSLQGGSTEDIDDSGIYCKRYSCEEFRRLLTGASFRLLYQSSSQSTKNTSGGNKTKTWLFFIAEKPLTLSRESSARCHCLLCPDARFSYERAGGMSAVGSILWGDQDCYVQPDLAPVVEGHLLLVCTDHLISFGACSHELQSSIISNQKRIAKLLSTAYNSPVLFFEHGPAAPGKAGSCIDHAHLHCVPIDFTLVQRALERTVGSGRPSAPTDLRQFHQEGKSYIYCQNGIANGYTYHEELLPSQFFRQILASAVNSSEWRWQSTFRTAESKARRSETLRRLLPLVDAL